MTRGNRGYYQKLLGYDTEDAEARLKKDAERRGGPFLAPPPAEIRPYAPPPDRYGGTGRDPSGEDPWLLAVFVLTMLGIGLIVAWTLWP